MPVLHRFRSQKADGADNTLVRPTNWNDGHDGIGPAGVTLVTGLDTTAQAANLAAGATNAVNDPSLRAMVDLRGVVTLKVLARIGSTLVVATKVRLQFHTGGNPNIATTDAGWTVMGTSAGSHVVNTLFEFDVTVPAAAQIPNCLLRPVMFDGDGVADPTITLLRVRSVY